MNSLKPLLNLLPANLLVLLLLVSPAFASSSETADGAPRLEAFHAGELQFPGETWHEVTRPNDWGWSETQLAEAQKYFEELESATVMVVHKGVLMASWGDVAARYNSQSMRKALVGAMLGQEVGAGRLDIESTLSELGIDDSSQPLTTAEQEAKLVHLLQSTSGIYLSALYETGGWKRDKPERGTHAPGEAWYYNNWGFNAVGTLFEQLTKSTIHDGFKQRIADPIGMEDYRPSDVQYLDRESPSEKFMKNDSEHRAYVFMISTRDMARFGLLYLAGGRWGEKQVVPEAWVKATSEDSVPTLEFLGGDRYGYLQWVSPKDSALGHAVGAASYKITGGRGHKTVVIPELELVIVHRLKVGGVDVESQMKRRLHGSPSVSNKEFNELAKRIVAAHPDRRSN